jgi:hypothetical protein
MWQDDLQSVVQMGYGQNQQQDFQGKQNFKKSLVKYQVLVASQSKKLKSINCMMQAQRHQLR